MIHLAFEDNKSGHDDVVLRFPGGEHRCDSYYFAIDGNYLPGDESVDKIRRVIRVLLSQWLNLAKGAAEVEAIYLPFDFSDQCTGWIRCQFDTGRVKLDVGWSAIEGWSFFPSDVGDMARGVTDFGNIENPQPITMDREALVAAIESNLDEFAAIDG